MAHSTKNNFRTPGRVKIVLAFVAFLLFLYVVEQHSYLELSKRKRTTLNRSPSLMKATSSSCHRCSCDCLLEMDYVPLPSDIFNSSLSDCAKNHPQMNEEMKKDSVTLLSEEINLHRNVMRSYLDSMQQSIIGVKQITSKYQKEAEKCNSGVQICEESRERAEASLAEELKLSALWEQRAREFGWKDESS